jgi:hypothetical protein
LIAAAPTEFANLARVAQAQSAANQEIVIRRRHPPMTIRLLPGALLPSAAVVGSPAYVGLHCFTDLDASSSMLDKQAVVVKLVFAYDVRSRRPNWGNLRLLDSEVLGEHLFDRLRTPLEHYKSSLPHRSLLTLKQSRQPLSWQLSYPYTPRASFLAGARH